MNMKIETEYLGMRLRSPLVVASSPLTWQINNFRHLEDAGASAIVLHSLFEMRSEARRANYQFGCLVGADAYAEQIQRAKQLVRVPLIASISCTTLERWSDFAALVESAGADALEINVHTAPPDLDVSGSQGEDSWFEIIAAVRAATKIPLSVKLIPYFTNLANVTKRVAGLGVEGVILFNRFYYDDIDIETRTPDPGVLRTSDMDHRLPLHWIGLLYKKIAIDFAASGGIHEAKDVIKLLMAGASVTMPCGVLMGRGIDYLRILERDLVNWLDDHGCLSVDEIRGVVSGKTCKDPGVFEQARYFRNLSQPPDVVGVSG